MTMRRVTVGVAMAVVASLAGVAGSSLAATTLPPQILGMSPATGSTGGATQVTIFGTNLSGTTKVTFGGAVGTSITNVSQNQITVMSPTHAVGSVHVAVTAGGGTSKLSGGDIFTYSDTPVVQYVLPGTGPTAGGTVVQIHGLNLSGTTAIKFGTTAATVVTNVSSSEVDATSPSGTGLVHVVVTTAKGPSSISGSDAFRYSDVPVVSYFSPSTGPTAGGTLVHIYGTNLSGSTTVKFGTTAATMITNVSQTEVDATSPAGSSGNVDIRVTTPKGTSQIPDFNVGGPVAIGSTGIGCGGFGSLGDIFTYSNTSVVSYLPTSTSPTAGGVPVQIHGLNLSGATAVKFGASPVSSITNVSPTEVDVVSPGHTAGNVDVTVVTPSGPTSIDACDVFTFTNGPVITSMSPNFGPGGTAVRIFGSRLVGTTSVSFGSVPGTAIKNVSATEVDVTAPAGSGQVDVVVTATAGTSVQSPSDLFSYSG